MANDTPYNGWTNRETWLVNLWFGDYFGQLVEEGEHLDRSYIEAFVSDCIEEALMPAASSAGLVRDLLNMAAIDYAELAEHYAPEAAEAEDEDEG